MRGGSPCHCTIMRLRGEHRFFLLTKIVFFFMLLKADKMLEMFIFPRVQMSGNLGNKSFTYKLKFSCSTQTKHK